MAYWLIGLFRLIWAYFGLLAYWLIYAYLDLFGLIWAFLGFNWVIWLFPASSSCKIWMRAFIRILFQIDIYAEDYWSMPNPGLEGIIFEIKCVLSNCNFYNFIVLKLPTKEFNPGKNCTVYPLDSRVSPESFAWKWNRAKDHCWTWNFD